MNQELKRTILDIVRTNPIQLIQHGYMVTKRPLTIKIVKKDDFIIPNPWFEDYEYPPLIAYTLTVSRKNQVTDEIITEKLRSAKSFYADWTTQEWNDVHDIYCAMEKKAAEQGPITRREVKQHIIRNAFAKTRNKTR